MPRRRLQPSSSSSTDSRQVMISGRLPNNRPDQHLTRTSSALPNGHVWRRVAARRHRGARPSHAGFAVAKR